jgi:hypothetical protein
MKNQFNLILIPSVIRNPVLSFHMSEQERLNQLLNTIKSCVSKIPNYYIVVLEGGTYNQEDKNCMLNAGANEVFNYDLVENGKRLPNHNRSKSYGEMTLFLEYFSTNEFFQIKDSLLSISKAGGRILLNDKFIFTSEDICVMNFSHLVWSGKGACSGRYWKIPIKHFNHFYTQLKKLYEDYNKDESIIDIEHGFYQYNVVPLEGLEPNTISGVSLFVSTSGVWEDS